MLMELDLFFRVCGGSRFALPMLMELDLCFRVCGAVERIGIPTWNFVLLLFVYDCMLSNQMLMKEMLRVHVLSLIQIFVHKIQITIIAKKVY
jgi:hypothetical protein